MDMNRTKQRKNAALLLSIPFLLLIAWPPIRSLMGQITLALLLTIVCLPIQKRLERKWKKGVAALISVMGTVSLLMGILILAVPALVERFGALIQQIPGLLDAAKSLWKKISGAEWFEALRLNSDLPLTWLNAAGEYAAREAPRWLGKLAGSIEKISRAFLAPVLAFYFLRDRALFCYQLSLFIPLRYRKISLKVLREMRREVNSFLRGQGMISLAVAVMTALGLMVLGIPSWLALGVMMGICEMIPYIGPLIGGIPVVLFSLPLGINKTLWAVGMVMIVQQLEGYFLSPRLMAGAVSVHPVYVLLLLTAGGMMGGLMGMMVAIPLFVCARGAMRIIYVEKQSEKVVNFFENGKG